jgi:PAS domain S-box-containing protein
MTMSSTKPGVGESLLPGIDNKVSNNTENLSGVLSGAVEQSPHMVIITDSHGLIRYVNQRFSNVTGFSSDEVLGQKYCVLIPGSGVSIACEEIRKTLNSGKPWHGNLRQWRKNGELFWERLAISPIVDKDGRAINYLAIGEDITHEIMISQKLAESEKLSAVGLLAAGVAHEFKNYLCGIIGNASHLLDEDGDIDNPAQVKDTLSAIIDIAEQVDGVTTSLLSYSQVETNHYLPEDMQTIIERALRLTRHEMTALSIEVLTYFEDIPRLKISPGRIQLLLLNLLTNAQQAIGSNGIISVSLLQDGNHVHLRVGDSGSGISPENINRIYDPFFSTKGVWGGDYDLGTGMGLSICRNIARQHQGDLTVNSIPGGGTVITLSLPIMENEQSIESHSRSTFIPLSIILMSSKISTIEYYFAATQKPRMLFYPVRSLTSINRDYEIIADVIICDADNNENMKLIDTVAICESLHLPFVFINSQNMKTPPEILTNQAMAIYENLPDLADIFGKLTRGLPIS